MKDKDLACGVTYCANASTTDSVRQSNVHKLGLPDCGLVNAVDLSAGCDGDGRSVAPRSFSRAITLDFFHIWKDKRG